MPTRGTLLMALSNKYDWIVPDDRQQVRDRRSATRPCMETLRGGFAVIKDILKTPGCTAVVPQRDRASDARTYPDARPERRAGRGRPDRPGFAARWYSARRDRTSLELYMQAGPCRWTSLPRAWTRAVRAVRMIRI